MPKNSSGLQAIAKLASALYPTRCVDARALYWASDDQTFAAASLTGQRLWEVQVTDGDKLVGVIDGKPVVLTSRLDPPFELELLFLDPSNGSVVRRVAAPRDAREAAYSDGVFAFLVESKRFGPTNTLVLVDATTGEQKSTAVKGELATDLRAIPGGFLVTLDHVFAACDREGDVRWKTDHLVFVAEHVLLEMDLGGKLARLRPEDGKPMWSFSMKGAPKKSLVHVNASADAVVVLEPTLGELALLELETGAQRWRTKRVVGSQQAPPLLTTDAVVALSTKTAGGDWPALAAFSLSDGAPRGELRTNDGFNFNGGLVSGEVCVLAEEGGKALHLVRVPAGAGGAKVTGTNRAPSAQRSVPRSSEPLPARLRERVQALGDLIEVTRFDVNPPAPAKLLDRAEKSIARPLPPALRALFGQCNGLELHWKSRRHSKVTGRISLLSVERMFSNGKVWGDEAFCDDIWLEDFADDLGEETLATFKSFRPIDRYLDSKPIAWHLTPEGDEQVVQIDRWEFHPLGADITSYIERLVDTLGREGYVEDATVRPPGDTSGPAPTKPAAKKSPSKKTAAKKT